MTRFARWLGLPSSLEGMLTVGTLVLSASMSACQPVGEEELVGSNDGSAIVRTVPGPRWKVLNVNYQVQETEYWCGPAATRVAISARRPAPSQGRLAGELGTTYDGTDWIGQVTRVMNGWIGGYETREIPNNPPTPDQWNRLWRDVVRGIDYGYPVVANIVAPPWNHPPGYPNYTIYHYVAVIGYNPDNMQVFIADSAYFGGRAFYWIPFNQLALLISSKGYSAWFQHGTTCPGGRGPVIGSIEQKYLSLGGCGSFLGVPLGEELVTPDRNGRFSAFANGSIYWTERTGAHEVHGAIRDTWRDTGWELGPLGYPTSDEHPVGDDIGVMSDFESGAVYYTPDTGAHEVYGEIKKRHDELGGVKGKLGYPTSGERDVPGGRAVDFEHGTLIWRAASGGVEVALK